MQSDLDLSLLGPVLKKYQGQEDALISMLQETQEVYGYLPEKALVYLSQKAGIPLSRIYAVATFYAQFYLTPRGRNVVRVCRGTACHVRGGKAILEQVKRHLGIGEGETTPDFEYTLETVACIGVCAIAPNMVINNITYGHLDSKKVSQLLRRKGKV